MPRFDAGDKYDRHFNLFVTEYHDGGIVVWQGARKIVRQFVGLVEQFLVGQGLAAAFMRHLIWVHFSPTVNLCDDIHAS